MRRFLPAGKEDREMIVSARPIAFAAILAAVCSMSGCDRLAALFAGRAAAPQGQQLEMARAENAVAMPSAAKEDAVVVAVTRDGAVLVGQNRVDPGSLDSMVRDLLADRVDKTVYLMADARVQYGAVEDVLDRVRAAGVDEVGLLTQSKEVSYYDAHQACCKAPGSAVGLDVIIPSGNMARLIPARIENAAGPGSTIVVQVLQRAGGPPAYKINQDDVPKAELAAKLSQIFAARAERVLFLKGDDEIAFAAIAEAVDMAYSAGADHIALLTPAMMAGR